MIRRSMLKAMLLGAFCSVAFSASVQAANETLKIGFVGVTSGPAAAWGISNVRSMQARAEWLLSRADDLILNLSPTPETEEALP